MGVLKEISQNPDNGSKSSENQNNDTISSKRALKCHFVSILCTLITLARNGLLEHFQCLLQIIISTVLMMDGENVFMIDEQTPF